MRPDQHKKKQSAAYKKKHGIKDSDVKAKKEEAKSGNKGKHVTQPTSVKLQDKLGEAERKYVNLPSFSSSSDEELKQSLKTHADKLSDGRGVVKPGKRFQKRQVVSNWSRYEGQKSQEDEHKSALRGADFSQLLQSAGDALAQFRFKDEEDWDEDAEDDNMLALDITDLAHTVNSVPLHQRLNISKEHFTEDMIQSFGVTALKYQESFEQPQDCKQRNITSYDSSSQDSRTVMEKAVDTEVTVTTVNDIIDDILSDKPKCQESQASGVESSHPDNTTNNQLIDQVDVIGNSGQEDDLDFLLSLENPIKHANNQVTTDAPSDVTSSTDDKSNTCEESANLHLLSEYKPSKTENLEDWLDSVLDD